MRTTDAQVRKLMDEMHRHGELGTAGLRAGLSPNTARKYVRAGRLPSELTGPRTWRTREDPFAADWAELRARLADVPELEAKTLFEDLLRRKPDGTPRGSCGRCNGGSSGGARRRDRRRRSSSRSSTGRARRCRRTSPGRVRSGSRSAASHSRTCSATRCCRTRTGSGRRFASRSRWRRCGAACRRRSASSGARRRTTRPTTRRPRPTIYGRASGASTRSTWRSCSTSA